MTPATSPTESQTVNLTNSPAAIRSLQDVRFADTAEVGGKAASLGELLAAGFQVPAGVVLTADAADMTVMARGATVRTAAEALGTGPFAVRSSGVAEDGADQSYAGMFESVLDVPADQVPAAVERTLASAHLGRAAEYRPSGDARMAVIIQQMIAPTAAGVVLTADPINGDRDTAIVTAVRGLGDRLVSGAASGDEWVVRNDTATARRQPDHAIDGPQAVRVAREARRIAAARGTPQDIEWAIDGAGSLWIVQARPMTALPPEVSWESPAPGVYVRSYRFGEWISEPVTPLFESWLLQAMEARLHALLKRHLGQHAPLPLHVVVNGWYFYSLNWFSPASLLRSLPSLLSHLVRDPRRVAGVLPQTVRFSYPVFERDWRTEIQPRYRAAVAAAEERVEDLPAAELPALVDDLADLAGEYFTSVAALSGAAYKLELNLARFYRKYLVPQLGGSHLPLVSGFELSVDPGRHAVVSLDWWHAPAPLAARPIDAEARTRLVQARRAAETAAFAALASSARRRQAFRRLLTDAQHLVPIREEQTRELTLPWPVMRRAVQRIGVALVERGAIEADDDAFFLTRPELLAALGGAPLPPTVDVTARRAARVEQGRLVPPPLVGRLPRQLQAWWDGQARQVGAQRSESAIVSGTPASPGRARGLVRVIRGPDDFDELQPGEILVAPLTAPAWTPLFSRAAAVVTDIGSAAAHASIIAREYGIPAVVGCGDATARLRTGMRVTVDGSTGNVEPE